MLKKVYIKNKELSVLQDVVEKLDFSNVLSGLSAYSELTALGSKL